MFNQKDIEAYATERNWSPVELKHALENQENVYQHESTIRLVNGRIICTPASPEKCSYVRIMDADFEIAYWDSDEWHDAPEDVMGAMLGCAHGTDPDYGPGMEY